MFGITSFAQAPFATAATSNVIALILTENIGLADTNTQTYAFIESLSEPIILDDFNSAAGLIIVGIAENITSLADAPIPQFNFLQTLTEGTITTNDILSITSQFLASKSEAVTMLLDEPIVYFAALGSRSEPIDSADVIARIVQFLGTVTENLNANDTASILSIFNQSITETINLLDANATSGWVTVIDAQTVVWTGVNDAQSVTWVNVSDGQTSNWVIVNDIQP